ncbi:MAG: ABC transporter permease [Ferruginibacter sp.]
MINNYFRITWRHLVKNKTHSFINLSGLSVGIACSLLIMIWVQSGLSVDSCHKNGARLYKVYEREYYSSNIDGNYDTPGLLADELKKGMPEIEDAVMLQEGNHEATLRAGNKILKVDGSAAGAGLFSMFSYPLLQGNPRTALASTLSIAISKKQPAWWL